ncbi:MAG: HigA family addiction module antitoxin [Pseudomonadota bacterium]
MDMHQPPHPGEFILDIYLRPMGISGRRCAAELGVAPSTFHRLLCGRGRVTKPMALRLSSVLGRTPESWLALQHNHDAWAKKQSVSPDDTATGRTTVG